MLDVPALSGLEAEWEALARADETATFFHTPAWHKLAEDFEGPRSRPLFFDFGNARAVLPLQARKRWWGELLTSPFGTYSSLLCPPEIRQEQSAAVSAQISAQLADKLSRLNIEIPGSPFSKLLPVQSSAPRSQTRILRLENLDPEAWVAAWSRNHRRMLKTAEETGCTVRLAENAADVSQYHALYRRQTERWGRAARRIYPEELFQEAFRRFRPLNAMKLWLAESRDGIAAGRLCLHHGFHAVEWHAAAAHTAMEQGVNHLLVHAVVTRARDDGFKVYDFNPNPGLDAVDHFKRGFATEPIAFEGIRNRAGWVGAIAGLRDRLRRV